MDVKGAEMEEVEVEGVHFEVKGWRLRRCNMRSNGRKWRLRCILRLKGWRWRLRGAF